MVNRMPWCFQDSFCVGLESGDILKCDLEFVLNAPGEGDNHKFVESKRVYNPMLTVSHVYMVLEINYIYTKFIIIDQEGCFLTSGCDMNLTHVHML